MQAEKAKADIFIVDDESINIEMLQQLLEIKGYAVRWSVEGQAALELLAENPADLVLLDIRMPEMDGYEVCEALKANERTHHIPVIFISALDEIADKAKAFQSGGVDYITKPFHEQEIMMRLDTHLSLSNLRKNLQKMVEEQTDELLKANEELTREILVRRRTENRLNRLSVAIECADEDIIITDKNGVIEYVNPAFERITGYSITEVIGKTPRVIKSGRHDRHFYQSMWQMLLNKQIWKGRLTNRKKDGVIFKQEASIAPILDASGDISGFVSVKRDVTEQEKLKEQLIQARKMEAIGTLSGGIAHDFNNILAGIIGYAELALEEAAELRQETGTIQKHLHKTLEAGNRAQKLVHQISQFSRRDMAITKPTRIKPLIQETIDVLRATLPDTIQIEWTLMAANDIVNADSTQIRQVLMNLGANAYHAMRQQGGRMVITMENVQTQETKHFHTMYIPPGDYLKIEVLDTGCGIPLEFQNRIFEPYFTTQNMDEGAGLGLAVTLGIIESHNGLIEVNSTPERGTAVNIFLPVEPTETPETKILSANIPLGDGENVMLIDNDAFFLDAIQAHITMLGYKVKAFVSSLQALEVFKRAPQQFDLIITDQSMPEMTGMQLVKEIRQINTAIPIILCTGFIKTVSKETANNYAITKILEKPVRRQNLAEAISQALQKAL